MNASAKSRHVLQGAYLYGVYMDCAPASLEGQKAKQMFDRWAAIMPDELIRLAKDVQEYAFEECLND